MLKYKLKKEVVFNDGNSVSTDETLQKIEEDLEENKFKVETTSGNDVKRIFWVEIDNLITIKKKK
jgi:predicted nucleotide-binding protein